MMRLYSLFWRREITILPTIVRYFIPHHPGCQDATDQDTGYDCCKTMWSVTIDGSFSSAIADEAATPATIRKRKGSLANRVKMKCLMLFGIVLEQNNVAIQAPTRAGERLESVKKLLSCVVGWLDSSIWAADHRIRFSSCA